MKPHINRSNQEYLGSVAHEDLGTRARIIDLAAYREARSSLQAHPEIAELEARQLAAQTAGNQIVQNSTEVTDRPNETTQAKVIEAAHRFSQLSEADRFLQDAYDKINEAHSA